MEKRKPEIDDVWVCIDGRNFNKVHILDIAYGKISFMAIDRNGNIYQGYEDKHSFVTYYKFLFHSDINAHQLF